MSMLAKLPYFISYFLGYRKPDHVNKSLPMWKVLGWSFLTAWIGIAVLEIIFTYSADFQAHDVPMIIASFGATAVLTFGVIDAPLSQPRNVIGGHIIGSITGVIIAQLFLNIQHHWASEGQYTAVQWVGGATAMALSLTIMQLGKCVHPPAGATALIAVVTPGILELAWFYIGVITLSAVIVVAIACLMNNVERRYPQYWWTPHGPIKIDPTTIATVIPELDNVERKEDVVYDNLTGAEEGRLRQGETTERVTSSISANAVDDAISILQKYAHSSATHYTLITPDLPVIITPGVFDDSDEKTLDTLLEKLHARTQLAL